MNLLRANSELLQQGIELLNRLDQRIFCATDPASFGSAIGSHFRHVADHYRSFLDGVATGLIDYDRRDRNTDEEKELTVALAAMSGLQQGLENAQIEYEREVKVNVRASVEGEGIYSHSSFGRELQFLVSHTVHHYAIIAIASRMHGVFPSDDFGVAPSTLTYLKSVKH